MCIIEQVSKPQAAYHEDPICGKLPHFDYLSYYKIFFQASNSISYFYYQTEMMLSWEFLAALLGKGKTRQVM